MTRIISVLSGREQRPSYGWPREDLIRKDCLWTSNGYREQTKDFDFPASQKDWTKYPDSSWAGVLVDATNRVGCYYVVNIAAKTGKTWYVEISNNIR